MKYCENCGALIEEGTTSMFCEQCGAAIDSPENPTREDVEKEREPAIKASESESIPRVEQEIVKDIQNKETQPRPRKIKWVFPFIGFFILIALIGGGYWWLNRPNEPAEVSTIRSSYLESSEPQPSTTVISTEQDSESSSSTKEREEEIDKFPTIIGQLSNDTVGKLSVKKGIYVASVSEKSEPYMNNGYTAIRSASIIKLFLMEVFYSQVQEGIIRLNEPYVLKEYDKVDGTGVIQNMAEGSMLTYEDLVRHMIVDSDNTAGNILLTILGGPSLVTQFIHEQGYLNTRVERQFLDTTALANGLDNYTSAEDVGKLLTAIYQQQSVSSVYAQQMLAILKENKNQTKLPAKIGSEVVVFNKTGEYSDYGVQSDACIFEKNGTAFVIVVLSQDGNEAKQAPEAKVDIEKRIFTVQKDLSLKRFEYEIILEKIDSMHHSINVENVSECMVFINNAMNGLEHEALKAVYHTFIERIDYDKTSKKATIKVKISKQILEKINEYSKNKASIPDCGIDAFSLFIIC